jgi:hypothetical protein
MLGAREETVSYGLVREETVDWGLVRRGGEYIRDKLLTDRGFFFFGVASLSQTIRSRACRECGAGTSRYALRRRRTDGGREKRGTTGD